jgi:uncharacterized protein involved in type VI secretion and phage assembly
MHKRPAPPGVGVERAVVVDNDDPLGLGRVQVELSSSRGEGALAWARVATLSASDGQGTWFPPQPGDEVVVAFEHADLDHPIVVGALWGGSARPPERGPQATERTTIRTRAALVRIDEPAGGGASTITLWTDAGDEVILGGGRVTVRSAGAVTVTAAAQVRVEAPQVRVTTPVAEFEGVVRCDTLMATNVVASSYTPGAGNVM